MNNILPSKDWPHAPVHRLDVAGTYIVTAATLHKEHLFKTPEKLTLLENTLLRLAKRYLWQLEAWAVFSNHYHFIGRSQSQSENLRILLKHVHADSAWCSAAWFERVASPAIVKTIYEFRIDKLNIQDDF